MGSGPVRPRDRANAGEVVALIAFAAAVLPGLFLWIAGGLGALVIHHRWPPAPVTVGPALTFGLRAHWSDPAAAWPAAARSLVPGPFAVYGIALAILVPTVGAVVLAWRALHPGRARSGLARRNEVRRSLSAHAVRTRRAQVRPGLGGRRIPPPELGVGLGRDASTGQTLWASLEDSFLVLGPPRSGKGQNLVIPGVIRAPGAVVVTSTRPDVLRHTAGARPAPVEVFDPHGQAGWDRPLRWSPVRGCEDPLIAIQRAGGFATGAGFQENTTDADFWTASAAAVIRCYLHAAALANLSMTEVLDWAFRPGHPEPVRILRTHPKAAPTWDGELASLATSERETRDSIWSGVHRGFDCFADPRVLATCTPAADSAFDAESFLGRKGTLYIVGSASAQLSVAPLISALIEDITERAQRLAYSNPHGRMDPPLSLWLDEAANIAPLPSLPFLLSAGGGSGICTVVVLQSLAQARKRWGVHQAEAIWDASTVRVVLGGLGNPEDLSAISRIAGEVDEEVTTTSTGPGGRSISTTLRTRPVLSPERLRTLPVDTAVVLHRRTPPIEGVVVPWSKQPIAGDVRASLARTAERTST